MAFISILVSALLPVQSSAASDPFKFQTVYIDEEYGGNGRPGWVRAGDMDRDGDLDLVAGGGNALYIYENNRLAGEWQRHGSLDDTKKIGANGAVLFDVDDDGNLDVVSALYYGKIGWWKNPGGPLTAKSWTFYELISSKRFLHDLILVDLNGDGIEEEFIGNLNSGYQDTDIRIIGFSKGRGDRLTWNVFDIETERKEGKDHCHAGLDVGDINGDGIMDVAYSNGWYETPANPHQSWKWHEVTNIYGISNVVLYDVDGDADLDMVVSAGHHGRGVYWLENRLNTSSKDWKQNDIDPTILHPEGLAVVDLNADGVKEIVACSLDFKKWDKKVHHVFVYRQAKSQFRWDKFDIAPFTYPSHQLQIADLNKDGRPDIISEGAGYSVVSYHQNIR